MWIKWKLLSIISICTNEEPSSIPKFQAAIDTYRSKYNYLFVIINTFFIGEVFLSYHYVYNLMALLVESQFLKNSVFLPPYF